jgi:hypothetical protein
MDPLTLTAKLSTLDGDSARDRNLYLVRLADVHLHIGHLGEAPQLRSRPFL